VTRRDAFEGVEAPARSRMGAHEMAQFSYPGVYVEEIPSGVRTITGVSTSVTAFVGSAERGPIGRAVSIRDWASFERCFGGLSEDSELSFAVWQFFLNRGTEAIVVRLAKDTGATSMRERLQDGKEQAYAHADAYPLFIGDRSKREGIYALEEVDLFNLLCLPGVSDGGILADAAAYCAERRAFLIVDAPRDVGTPDDLASLLRSGGALPRSDNAAVFYPWIEVANPRRPGKLREVAPSGAIAGLFARTDATRGVWKAPAGAEATLNGAQAVRYALTDGETGVLNRLGVNCLRLFPVIGAVSWGARTLRGDGELASEHEDIPVKRLALHLEESLCRGTRWALFEPNDEALWAQLRLNVGVFMHGLFVRGAFAGKSPVEAYLVKCDRETTTLDDVDNGVVNVLVGFAPLRPAEFVVLRLELLAGGRRA
jgi:phage tail sheath protein FI